MPSLDDAEVRDLGAPFVAPSLGIDEVQLWFFALADSGRLAEQRAVLDEGERSRADAFHRAADRTAFIVSHATVRLLLGGHCGCEPALLGLRIDDGGKPVLAGLPDLHFSLSHSGGIGMIGIADRPLGVDVESLRALPDRDAIARRYFAPSEVKALQRMAEAERQDAFFACWTRKEALVKAIGLGLATPLVSFEVSVEPDRPALTSIDGDRGEAAAWSMWSARTGEGWSAAAIRSASSRIRTFRLVDGQGG